MPSDALDFNNHFINQIIFHSVQNDDFVKKIRRVVPLTIFKTREKELLIKIIFDYYDEYNQAPKDNFLDLFKEREKTMSEDLYNRCIDLIDVLRNITNSNPDYILNTINDAIRHFRLEEASVEFASLIKRKKYDEAKDVIFNAIRDPGVDLPYYDYFDDKTFIIERAKDVNYDMLTRIDALDNIIGGLRRGWLVTILGATKGGKTWMLMELAAAGVFQGLNVLFISLEMGKAQIDSRFDMIFGFMKYDNKPGTTEVLKKVGDKFVKTQEEVDSIHNIPKVLRIRKKIKKIFGGNLKVMAFDRGRMNYRDINIIINELEETQGFYTDVLVVDYLGIMKEMYEGQAKKERISDNSIGLKELAGKKNLITITGQQGNRAAMKAKTFHSHLVADDIDCVFNSDLIPAICQTDFEEKHNKARLYIANFRHGNQHQSVGLMRDLSIGQVALSTYDLKKDEENDEENENKIGVDF